MKNLVLICTLSCILLASCSNKKVSILYNADYAANHKVMIDDSIDLGKEKYVGFVKYKIASGKHKLSVEGKPAHEFVASEDEGILNIAGEEFVMCPIKYTLGNDASNSAFGLPNGIVLKDSFVVCSDWLLTAYARKMFTRQQALSWGNGTDRTELRKTARTSIYIPKTWDFNMTKDNPSSVSEEVSEGVTKGDTYRTKVLNADGFLNYVKTTGNFHIIPLSSLD